MSGLLYTHVGQLACLNFIYMSENSHPRAMPQGSVGGPKKDGTQRKVPADYRSSPEATWEFQGMRCLEGSQEQGWGTSLMYQVGWAGFFSQNSLSHVSRGGFDDQ